MALPPAVEKTLLWNPRREEQFLLSRETQVALYEWVPQLSEFKLVASHADSHPIKVSAGSISHS